MTDFFSELAKKLAERWVALLAVPGLIFVTAAAIGIRLSWAHAWDVDYALSSLDTLVAEIGRWPVSRRVIAAAGLLLAASCAGLTAGGLAAGVRAVWLGQWPTPFGAVVARKLSNARRDRWHRLEAERFELEDRHSHDPRAAGVQMSIDQLAARANRIAMAPPTSPTWMGDRFKAVETISYDRYGLDMVFVWPALWLTVPDLVRSETTAAGGQFADATVRGAWATLYAVLALLWPPVLVIALILGFVAWRRGRAAAAAQTECVEAAVDLYGRALADALAVSGPARTGPLSVEEGRAITRICRKGR